MSMTLRLPDEQDDILAALAKRMGVSKNEAAPQAILDRVTCMERCSSTLQRLGE